jgi:hypothetical protein
MAFYDITQNLGNFNVQDPALETRQNVNNLRQYQYQTAAGYSAHINQIILDDAYTTYSNPYIPSEEEVLNWNNIEYITPINTGAFTNGGAGDFMTGSVKRYYIRWPLFLAQNTGGYFPFQQTVIQKFGFKQQLPEDYRPNIDDPNNLYTSNSIPPYFNLGALYRVQRGTEIYISAYDDTTPGSPLFNYTIIRNAYDWISINALKGPTSAAYQASSTVPSDPVPLTGIAFVPVENRYLAWGF